MKITLKKHPELKLADELLKIFPKAIIAGGVARDLINGKEFKDVDIFIPAPTATDLSRISMDIGFFATELQDKPKFLVNYFYTTKTLVRIGISNLDICILNDISSDPEKLVSTFDMVSSQAWLEPVKDGFEVKATDLFYELNDKKVLGFYEEVSGGKGHIERVKEKYPDYLPLSLKYLPLCREVQAPVDDGFDDIPF